MVSAVSVFFLLQGQFFVCVCDDMVSDTGKKSNLVAYLRTQALLLGEILTSSIVLHKNHISHSLKLFLIDFCKVISKLGKLASSSRLFCKIRLCKVHHDKRKF